MQVELSTSEIDALRKLQRNPAGSPDYVRVTCILMLSTGNSPSFVSECPGIDGSSVYRYRNAYLHGGAGELLENRRKGYRGLPDSRQLPVLRQELKRHIYADGVHPAHNSRSAYARTEKGEELSQPTVNGRERVNINGLPNAYDVTDVTARDCDSVNAQSAKALHEAALIRDFTEPKASSGKPSGISLTG